MMKRLLVIALTAGTLLMGATSSIAHHQEADATSNGGIKGRTQN